MLVILMWKISSARLGFLVKMPSAYFSFSQVAVHHDAFTAWVCFQSCLVNSEEKVCPFPKQLTHTQNLSIPRAHKNQSLLLGWEKLISQWWPRKGCKPHWQHLLPWHQKSFVSISEKIFTLNVRVEKVNTLKSCFIFTFSGFFNHYPMKR